MKPFSYELETFLVSIECYLMARATVIEPNKVNLKEEEKKQIHSHSIFRIIRRTVQSEFASEIQQI